MNNNTLDRCKSVRVTSQTIWPSLPLPYEQIHTNEMNNGWQKHFTIWGVWFPFRSAGEGILQPMTPQLLLSRPSSGAECQFIAAVANCHFIERTMYETSTSPKCCCGYTSLAQFLFFCLFLFCLNIQIAVENLTNPRRWGTLPGLAWLYIVARFHCKPVNLYPLDGRRSSACPLQGVTIDVNYKINDK